MEIQKVSQLNIIRFKNSCLGTNTNKELLYKH